MPILCAVVVLFIPNEKVDVMKKTVIGFMGVNLLLTLFMFAQYNVSEGGMQFVENISCSRFAKPLVLLHLLRTRPRSNVHPRRCLGFCS